MADEGKFQVAVGAVIRHRDSGRVLLLLRSEGQFDGGIWEMPSGRLKQFESFADGLKREIAEEAGITSIAIDRPIRVFEFMRGDHAASNEVRAVMFAVTTDQEKITLSDEHREYKWVTIDEAIELVEHSGVKRDLEAYKLLCTN